MGRRLVLERDRPQTLAERWNGTAWKVVPTPNPGGPDHTDRLTAVDATSRTNVWAVGWYKRAGIPRTLTMRWDGAGWTRVRSPNPGGSDAENVLNGVAVISPSDVWAVGYHNTVQAQGTLVLHWDGARWSHVPSPNPSASVNLLKGVSASSASDVWAVGYIYDGVAQRALTLHWDGGQWSSIAGPTTSDPNESVVLFGVAIDPDNTWAVGYTGCCVYSTAVAKWDGVSWQLVPSSGGTVFKAVDADASGPGWAVGYYFNGATARASITECC